MTARYDGHTDWYESYTAAEMFASARGLAVELLGSGPGRCLDLGCGRDTRFPRWGEPAGPSWAWTSPSTSLTPLARAPDATRGSSAPTPTRFRSTTRVGVNHLPLAALLNAIVESGLTISQVQEPGEDDPPLFLAVRATKAPSTG